MALKKEIKQEDNSTKPYFSKKEINELSSGLEKYFQNLEIPKYYDIIVHPLDEDNEKFVLIGNLEYGDIEHDHLYFDEQAQKYFQDKGIDVQIYEPTSLKDSTVQDDIYSSGHVIQKQGEQLIK